DNGAIDVATANQGGNGFVGITINELQPAAGTGPVYLASADLNGDHKSDLIAVNSSGTPGATIYLGSNTTPGDTLFPFNVNITDPKFHLSDLTVALNLIEPNLRGVSLALVPSPSVQTILKNAGVAADADGIIRIHLSDALTAGPNLGVLN